MSVLSLSSQVAVGHVGNSATAFALRRLGHEVHEVPTVVLSHHPGHGTPAGMSVPPATVAAMLRSVVARARPARVFSGYLADPENGENLATLVDELRRDGPVRLFLDPVIGDSHTGVYVRAGVAECIRDRLLPRASLLLPNRFELGWLTGIDVIDTAGAVRAARSLLDHGPSAVVCTSAPAGPDEAATLVVERDASALLTMRRIPDAPHGTGDLFAGVLLARLIEGLSLTDAAAQATASVHAVIAWSRALAAPDLALVAAQSALSDPPIFPEIHRL